MARQNKNTQKKTEKKAAVVGEGETEYYYFDDIRAAKKYNFKLTPDLPTHTKSDYASIFKRAESLKNDGYDMVFCIIDYDTIAAERRGGNYDYIQKYENAKRALQKTLDIFVIETMPCLEYWFLLHYTDYSTRVYQTYKDVIVELRKHLRNYDKTKSYLSKANLFAVLEPTLKKATENAQKLWKNKEEEEADRDVPFSDMPLVFSRFATL